MKDINYLYDNIYSSNVLVSVIGYSSSNEHLKDEFISRIPHCSIKNIRSSFNIKQYLRDIKIDKLLNRHQDSVRFLVIDVDDVILDKDNNNWGGYSIGIGNLVSSISLEIRSYISNYITSGDDMGLDFDDFESHNQITYDPPFSLIITSRINKSPSDNVLDKINLKGGIKMLYTCDFAFYIQDKDYVKVIKDRNNFENVEVNISDLIEEFNKRVYKDKSHEYSK